MFSGNFACRSQESVTQHHSDKEKPHLHLLSTHFYIRDYKTIFVNRPRQLVKLWLNQLTRSIDETSFVVANVKVC